MIKKEYTPLEARMLDLLLVLQAEHGGGNNSTFTVRVTSSTRTDTYSSIAAGIGSLKGPLHGGANIQVVKMFHHLKEVISDWTNVDEIDTYLLRMLNKEAYDGSGLIYGIGHAVYTISDPRAVLLKELASELVAEKGREKEFAFLELLEQRAIEVLQEGERDEEACLLERGLLFGIHLRDDRPADGDLYASLRNGPYCGMDCTPHRGAEL